MGDLTKGADTRRQSWRTGARISVSNNEFIAKPGLLEAGGSREENKALEWIWCEGYLITSAKGLHSYLALLVLRPHPLSLFCLFPPNLTAVIKVRLPL